VLFREAVLAFFGVGGKGKEAGKCTAQEMANCKAQFGEYFEWACKHCEKKVTVSNE